MPNKQTTKGRSKFTGRFVQLHHWMMKLDAWKATTPAERAVWLELAALYDGSNNGRLALSARSAADRCNISKNTATAAFRGLQEKGFVELVTPGGFSRKVRHAAEWRLTHLRCDKTGEPPSKAYGKWKPGKK